MQLEFPAHAGASVPASSWLTGASELWRGAWVIFTKHMVKFTRNGAEVGGTLAAPLLLAITFGAGMTNVVDTATLGGLDYISYITPGILAFTALSAAVNAGMTMLEEKIRGFLKEYLAAPIPRFSILLASTLSGLLKALVQSVIILLIAVLFGARVTTSVPGLLGAVGVLALFMLTCVGFSNAMALRSKSIGGYHTMLFLLNLPLLFLSNALYPLATMPRWMQIVAYVNPTTYVVDGLRRTLFGAGTLPLALCFGVLTFYAAICLWFGVRSFRRVL